MNLKQFTYVCVLMSGLVASSAIFCDCDNRGDQKAPLHIYKHLQAQVGQEITIELDMNGTTGYQWDIVDSSKKLHLVSQTYVTNILDEIIGSGCKEIIKFIAYKPGKAKVTFAYRRPWENAAPLKMVTYVIAIDFRWKKNPIRGN